MGTLFSDPTLNENFVEPETGEIKPIYTYKEEAGKIIVRCEICQLNATGKYNLDTHREGKKHRANIQKFEMSSKFHKIGMHKCYPLKYLVSIFNNSHLQRYFSHL